MKKGLLLFLLLSFGLAGCSSDNTNDNFSSRPTTISESSSSNEPEDIAIFMSEATYSDDTVTFDGRTFGNANVSILHDGKEIAKSEATKSGTFSFEIPYNDIEDKEFELSNGYNSVNIKSKSKVTLTAESDMKASEEEAEKLARVQESKERVAKQAQEQQLSAERKAKEDEAKKKSAEKASLIASATREQKNALNNAKDYLDYTAFSKSGLYDQLIHEQYPSDAAQFAIDNIEVNWNDQALQKAKDYLDYTSFSDQGLYDQLIHEGFTVEESQYAIDNLPN
ncbi:MAG: Ltp family lipoprotein [Enterococcus devriesei]|uniref:Ltp family lipoprotein n=1 Tax=Enterococcus devriesei TaxID=319970 RepID=UPI003F90B060